jgi:mannose-6-phosphate isomerase-like protein (cupin superfamily)
MNNTFNINPNFANVPFSDPNIMFATYKSYPNDYSRDTTPINSNYFNQHIPNVYEKYDLKSKNTHYAKTEIEMKDYGPEPFKVNIEEITLKNNNFRTVLWTGEHMQLTLMSINPGEDIGLEIHPELDQFLRIEEGQGIVKMGDNEDNLDYQEDVFDDFAFIIPAGKWHNLINTGTRALKLYSIYAPPQHPKGTIHKTKEDAMASENSHSH